jgi:hypothetical protein
VIRILRAPAGAGITDGAWERAASVWSGDHDELARALAGSFGVLVGAEADAVRSAARELAPLESADVLVAAEGAIFRVIPRKAAPAPAVACPVASGKGFTSFPGAVVLFLSAGEDRGARFADALRFVGYDARHAPAPDAFSAIAAIRAASPRVVLVAAGLLRAFEPGWLKSAREGGSFAVVSVGSGRPILERDADAAIDVPVRLELVADVLDPLLEGVSAKTRSA